MEEKTQTISEMTERCRLKVKAVIVKSTECIWPFQKLAIKNIIDFPASKMSH